MDTSQDSPRRPGIFRRSLRLLSRLILSVLFGILLGLALYFGIPALYHQFIQPVQEHTQQIDDLQASQATAEAQANERIATLTSRLVTVELQSDTNKAAIAEQDSVQMMEATSEARLNRLQSNVDDLQIAISTQEASLEGIQTKMEGALATLNVKVDSQAQWITTLENAQSNFASASELNQQLRILQSMQLLLRAEFYLSQSNNGLAYQDIQAAIAVLQEIPSSASLETVNAVGEVVSYLKDAETDLPASPVIANDKLVISWQILSAYLQGKVYTPVPTQTPTPVLESTPTQILIPTATLTSTNTPTP